MKLTTLCYITEGERWLLLHRTKKENDENAGMWIGVGGKLETGECPEECLTREVFEETGLTLENYKFRGIVTFITDVWDDQMMFLYTSDSFTGSLKDCDEGQLKWVEDGRLDKLPMWEGDRIFFDLIKNDEPFFSLKLTYKGDALVSAKLNGRDINI